MNYSRIKDSIDLNHIRHTHVVIVGAGGSYSLISSFARMGIGRITVIDFDTVETSNIVRQGYKQENIGQCKVVALQKEIRLINPDIAFNAINKNLLTLSSNELDNIFLDADLLLFLTDSFQAQAYGNIIALQYNKPAIWAGWYAKSRTAEVFYQVPHYTEACFRCCASTRYEANKEKEIKVNSQSNTIFHSQLLDALIGMIAMGILHLKNNQLTPQPKEFESFINEMKSEKGILESNFFQFKVHPKGGNRLFDEAFDPLGTSAHNFISYWQKVKAELKINGHHYNCPDCHGQLYRKIHQHLKNKIQ